METTSGSAEESDLIARARGGDRPAFAQLVEQYWDCLYRWVFHICHDRHLAEDLTQESLLRAFKALTGFTPGTNFKAWLFRIAYHAFLNQRRGSAPLRQSLPAELVSGASGPLEMAMDREALRALTRAVGRLPSEFRAAFLLRVEQGMSMREIADVLDLTEETARWRIFKAREKLMQLLEPHLREDQP